MSRNDLVYLKNLFIFLCHHASPSSSASGGSGSSAAAAAIPPAHLNQSQSSAALASPSNLELMALRLPRALVLRHLLSPSFPSLSPAMLERCYAIFDYHGYGAAGLDYSEFLVMMYTLWHSNPHDELARFLFVLCDPGQSGRVAAKHYRRVATALWTDQAAYCAAGKDAAGGTAATGAAFLGLTAAAASTAKDPTGKGGAAEREWLTAMFDFYFVLACFHVSTALWPVWTRSLLRADAASICAWRVVPRAHWFRSWLRVCVRVRACPCTSLRTPSRSTTATTTTC